MIYSKKERRVALNICKELDLIESIEELKGYLEELFEEFDIEKSLDDERLCLIDNEEIEEEENNEY